MSKPFIPTPHPVLALPTPEQAMAMGADAFGAALMRREQIIREEKADPLNSRWEPPIWKVCDALLGFPWVDDQWAVRMRKHLGFAKPVNTLLINGGQRAGKTQYACTRIMLMLGSKAVASAWMLHSNLQMSQKYHQEEIWRYLPEGLKQKSIRSETTYIAYKQKTGFAEQNFVLPPTGPGLPGSDLTFKTYEQDVKGIEGGNLDLIHADELVPSDWVETMKLRIAERNGRMLVTFTPVQGYNDTVKLFQDGAEVVKESISFVCPADGGEPDLARALGLTPEELQGNLEAEEAKPPRSPMFPQSRPEDCNEWLEGRSGQMPVPAGREFDKVPRVMKCIDPDRAVVFFHSTDNPYGNPKGVWSKICSNTTAFKKERFHGLAHKTTATRFPKFSINVHVVRPDQIPAEGTNYHYADPSSGKNFFMLWFRVTPEHVYVYREWPGLYYIEGVGIPGPWALPDGKKADGKEGPGRETFGWGLRDYKKQIALLEGWKDAKQPKPERMTMHEWIDGWDEWNGSVEAVQMRKLDSRFASTPKLENDRPVTLLTQFEDLGLMFLPTPGGEILGVNAEGSQLINDALNYDETKPVDFFNKPRLLISSDCQNLIFALRTWTGKDGTKGATKDPIDVLHYFLESDDCPYTGGKVEEDEEDGDRREYY